ncbi:uncharacterized protein V1477_012637 [Vespula maculifrons]|uniref:Apolipophorin-III n=2 Tax=Vespula TaxID=7451 RepID=A0A834JQ96_VESVU|nr:uncharacterized protein LOC122631997 [Vespula pensylvanica]XP_050857356.1 uncharacterized protein LOC127066996 [Vespula vulgaris]KAF7392828.1 hypothetical protein HZH66_008661 [Vespula vulgaris]
MKIAYLIVLTVFLVYTEAKIVPSSNVEAQQTNQPLHLSELISQAQANINTLAAQFQEKINLPDQETIVNTVKEQSTSFVNNLQQFVKNVTEQVSEKTPELERLWVDVKGKLNKVVEDINAQIPNASEQVNQLQTKLQEGLQVLVQESDKTAKAVSKNSEKVQEDIAKFTKQAVELAVETTQNLNTQLQQAAKTS